MLLILSIWGIFVAHMPLGTAIEIGNDEHYELTLGLLCQHGYTLYNPVWNDQPPLLPRLLGLLFSLCGPSILAARLLAVCFGFLLWCSFFYSIYKTSGPVASFTGLIILVCSPSTLELSMSIMQEGPAWAMGLTSALFVFQRSRHRHPGWIIGSGVLMAVALQLKLTAALLAPAILAEIAIMHRDEDWRSWLSKSIMAMEIWIAAVAATFIILALILGYGGYDLLWASHQASSTYSKLAENNEYGLSWRVFRPSYFPGVLAGFTGLIVSLALRSWRKIIFPGLLLLTVISVHVTHRPWWWYYSIHLAIPLAWLGGYAINELIRYSMRQSFPYVKWEEVKKVTSIIGVSTMVVVLLFYGGRYILEECQGIQAQPRILESNIIAKMKEYRTVTRWAYADEPIYAFHAQLLTPPEIAILPLKRFLSGRITRDKVLTFIKRYQPEQLLICDQKMTTEWKIYVESRYILACRECGLSLYIARRLVTLNYRTVNIERREQVPE
jgi:hypothetical protein